jgi:hypothetical protein
MCATECIDPEKCSSKGKLCAAKAIQSENDFSYFQECNELCGLSLNALPNVDARLFLAFRNVTLIRGQLSVTNNKYLTSLDFLANVTIVSWTPMSPCDGLSRVEVNVILLVKTPLFDYRLIVLSLLEMIILSMLDFQVGGTLA